MPSTREGGEAFTLYSTGIQFSGQLSREMCYGRQTQQVFITFPTRARDGREERVAEMKSRVPHIAPSRYLILCPLRALPAVLRCLGLVSKPVSAQVHTLHKDCKKTCCDVYNNSTSTSNLGYPLLGGSMSIITQRGCIFCGEATLPRFYEHCLGVPEHDKPTALLLCICQV